MLLNARRIGPRAGEQLFYVMFEDVTEQRRQMEELQRQAALLDLVPETVIVRDLEGSIQFWSRGAEEMYGWKKEEAIGKTTSELLRPEFTRPFQEIEAELIRTGRWEGELVHIRRDGERRVVNCRWSLLKDNNRAPVTLEINTDITEKKRAEEPGSG
jgi:PAS domain S-box-containing protein